MASPRCLRYPVVPAPGEPGKIPFWHGDLLSQPPELERTLGQVNRELRAFPPEAAERRQMEGAGFDELAIRQGVR